MLSPAALKATTFLFLCFLLNAPPNCRAKAVPCFDGIMAFSTQPGATASSRAGASVTGQATSQAAGHCWWWPPKYHAQLETITRYGTVSFKSGFFDHPAWPQGWNCHSKAAPLTNFMV